MVSSPCDPLFSLVRDELGMVRQHQFSVLFFAVDGGERAVMFDRFRGVLDDVYGEGTHVMVPWLQNPQTMDIRIRPRVISSVTGTGDLQMVNLSLRVLSRPDKSRLPWIVKVSLVPFYTDPAQGPFPLPSQVIGRCYQTRWSAG
jgi:regulator of protease activity HflC (stomatin/prohibitin superfamily)